MSGMEPRESSAERFMRLPVIDNSRFQFHPTSYGIATLMRLSFIFKDGRKLMLHHFRPHAEEELHDHPWSFRTIVLWGSYVDESPCGVDVLKRGDRRYRPAHHAHRTSCTRHTWTLVLTSPKKRKWTTGPMAAFTCHD